MTDSLAQARAELAERLRGRWGEIERAVMARVYSISDPSYTQDAGYVEGLRSAVSVALDFGLAAIEHGGGGEPRPPGALLAQARLAAKSGVGLATVLRRYVAGYTLLSDFAMQEAEGGSFNVEELQSIARAQAVTFDSILAAVTAEYTKVAAERGDSPVARRAEGVKRLLAGEPADASVLAYELDAWHIGVLAEGARAGAETLLRELAAALDRRLLVVPGEAAGTVWGWLGGGKRLESERALEAAKTCHREGVTVALGEPSEGLDGWRLSHRQAVAALPVARRGTSPAVRYGEVALLASLLKDELLAVSLREIYLAPLVTERDDGETLRETLKAYFSTGRHLSSAAAALGIDRHTVANRLRAIEERLGRSLSSCASDIEIALRLDELGNAGSPRHSSPAA